METTFKTKVQNLVVFKNDAMESVKGTIIDKIDRFRYVDDNDFVTIVTGYMVQLESSSDIVSIPYWRIKSFG